MQRIEYDPWKVIRKLGSGSYGSVYEIRREEFGECYRAALKVISVPKSEEDIRINRSNGMDDQSLRTYYPSLVKDFTHEFSLLSKLAGNSNIVSYGDHKIVAHNDGIGWDIYIRMELLTSLRDITAIYTLSEEEVLKLGIDLCSALILCEKNNIIHRDIKPDNIFVSDNGDFKLGDFGIARVASKTMSNMTKRGTLNYMAPEVFINEPYNHRADIYSLGIVLYQLMNDRRIPFVPENVTAGEMERALQRRMKGEPFPAPANAGESFAGVICKACAYKPEDRYQDAASMKEDLMRLLNGKQPEPLDMDRIREVLNLHKQKLNETFSVAGDLPNQGLIRQIVEDGEIQRPDYQQQNDIPVVETTPGNARLGFFIGGILAALLLVLLAYGFHFLTDLGDGKDRSEEEQKTESVTSADSGNSTEEVRYGGSETAVSDDLNEYKFVLEGKTWQLPIPYETFRDAGWQIYSYDNSKTEDYEIASGANEILTMTNGAVDINVTVYNASGNVKPVKECYIGGIMVEAKDNLDFSVAGGISCRSAVQEILEIFKYPSYNNDAVDYQYLRYKSGDSVKDGETTFYFDKKHSANNSITLAYMPATDMDASELTDGAPDYFASYKAPRGLGSGLKDFVFELDGKYYQLPCPASEFVDDGWTISSDTAEGVGGMSRGVSATLEKEDCKISVHLINYDKMARALVNCAVYSINFNSSSAKDTMKGDFVRFSGGFNLDARKEELDKACKGFDITEKESFVSYSWYGSDWTSNIYFYLSDKDNFRYFDCKLQNQNWDYQN